MMFVHFYHDCGLCVHEWHNEYKCIQHKLFTLLLFDQCFGMSKAENIYNFSNIFKYSELFYILYICSANQKYVVLLFIR